MSTKFFYGWLCLLMLPLAVSAVVGDEPPAWLRQAAQVAAPTYPKEVHAVTLHDESRKVIDADGRITTYEFHAVRVLAREGRGEARAIAPYNSGSDKIKEMRAWLIRADGSVKSYGKKETADVAEVDNDIYSDSRRRLINASDEIEPGGVFGYEIKTEERTIFSQFVWSFQSDLPVLLSRVTLTMPNGWRAEGQMLNHAKLEPTVNANSYTWELINQSQLEDEPEAPTAINLAAMLVMNVFPPADKVTLLRNFATWKDVSRYTSELSDPQTVTNDAMAAKARELTANAKNEYERIQAIGRYAQAINYIAISLDVGRGGGHRPHAALDVFAKNYGDCKDKANLMRAMLKTLNIEAYPVVIYSGDSTRVRPDWASPYQFNHCIIAVKVSDAVHAPTVISHATLGRLLIFDPTDENTPFGDLPDHEQGSWALVCAGERGELVRMPLTPPEANHHERTIDASLDVEGNLVATVNERSNGQAAVTERRYFKRYSQADYLKMVERWISANASAAAISKAVPADDVNTGQFALAVEFKAPAYAKTMRGKLMVIKPAIVTRRNVPMLIKEKRTHPVVLEAEAYSDVVRIKLPDGFELDEMPDGVEIAHSFGKFAASWEVKDGVLNFKRKLILQAGVIPVEKYAEVRRFFQQVLGAEQASVVLARK